MSTKTQLGVRTTQHALRSPVEPRSHEHTTTNQSDQYATPFHARISERAYALYEQHGREDGHALDDWLEAEQQLTNQGS
jgi:hypothetical protein